MDALTDRQMDRHSKRVVESHARNRNTLETDGNDQLCLLIFVLKDDQEEVQSHEPLCGN